MRAGLSSLLRFFGAKLAAGNQLQLVLAIDRNAPFPEGNRAVRNLQRLAKRLARTEVGKNLIECHAAEYSGLLPKVKPAKNVPFGTIATRKSR